MSKNILPGFALSVFVVASALLLIGCPTPPTHEATIHRDVYGVPHVYADSEEEVMGGFAYAMASDQLETIVTLYRTANGTRAAKEGEGPGGGYVLSDYIVHLFRVPQSARAAYAGMSGQERAWLDGFAGGLNAYIKEYNNTHWPKVETFSPEDVLSWGIYGQFSRQLQHAQKDLAREQAEASWAGLFPESDAKASNQWVVGPPKTGGTSSMVLADPHLPWWGGNQWYEGHLKHTGGSLNVTGAAVLGSPLIAMGRNPYVAWSMTSNGMLDFADCYKEKLVAPGDLTEYVYELSPTGTKPFVQQEITIEVKGSSSVTVPAYYSHHGPVVPLDVVDDQPVFTLDGEHVYSLALSMMDGTEQDYPGDLISGMLLQIYRINTALEIMDVKLALGLQGHAGSYPGKQGLQMVKWNMTVGDVNGDIYYIYNGRIPDRINDHSEDPDYWDSPRQGWTGQDEWKRDGDGYPIHWAIANLPQAENPACGYLANCNVSPWHVCPESGIDPEDYPPYVCIENMTDRQLQALELLEGDGLITEADMRLYSRNTHIRRADKLELLFFSFYDSSSFPDLVDAADLLALEPNDADRENTSVALLFTWTSHVGGEYENLPDDPALLTEEQKTLLVTALREARDDLAGCPHGLAPQWGDVHYIDHGEIFPVGGGTGAISTLFYVGGEINGCGPMVADHGSSFMQVSALSSGAVTSRSVRPIGSSSDPANPHYNDETARFVEENPESAYRANPFTDQEVTEIYLESTNTVEW